MGKLLEVKIAPLLDDDPSAAELTEAMYSLHGETLGGILPPITFPRAKDRSEVNLCVIPVTFKGGKFVTRPPASPSSAPPAGNRARKFGGAAQGYGRSVSARSPVERSNR